MLTEQFIQDAICRPDRIERLLRAMGKVGWTFVEGHDNVNQEFNFSATEQGGRIDVLATLGGVTKLLIVEVKAGSVGDAAVDQLVWYLDHWPELKRADERLANVNEVAGALLAEGFLPMNADRLNKGVTFVKFDLAATGGPFTVVVPSLGASSEPSEGAVFKHSRLITLDVHRSYLSKELRGAFDRITACFLQKDEERHDWVWCNPKGAHVAIHYKGVYIVYVFAHKNSFDVGYSKVGGQDVALRMTADSSVLLNEMETDIRARLDEIDRQLASAIPAGFSWRT